MSKTKEPTTGQVNQGSSICTACKYPVEKLNRCKSCKLLFCIQCWNPDSEASDLCNDCWNDLMDLHERGLRRMLEENESEQ